MGQLNLNAAGNVIDPIEIGGHHFVLRYLQESDQDAFIQLHRTVFGSTFNADWYHWKYRQRTAPALGLWSTAGELIAHCAGLPRMLYLHSKPHTGLQIGDVMVDPKWRAMFTRKGPFYWVSSHFYQDQIGAKAPHQIAYGFPSVRHLRLAQKLDLSADGGQMWELTWPNKATTMPFYWQSQGLATQSSLWENMLTQAWQNMQVQNQKWWWAERSVQELQWRYREHPSHTHAYQVLKRPWSNRIIGVAIWRYTDVAQQDILWLDWIGSPQYIQTAQRMMAKLAHQKNARLRTWVSEPLYHLLENTGCTATHVAHLGIPTRSTIELNSVKEQPWWWMAGDTDFL